MWHTFDLCTKLQTHTRAFARSRLVGLWYKLCTRDRQQVARSIVNSHTHTLRSVHSSQDSFSSCFCVCIIQQIQTCAFVAGHSLRKSRTRQRENVRACSRGRAPCDDKKISALATRTIYFPFSAQKYIGKLCANVFPSIYLCVCV